MESNSRRLDTYYEYDCITCGACCISSYPSHSYVHVSAADATLLSRGEQDELLIESRHPSLGKLAMRARLDSSGRSRCAALRGSAGDCVSCSVYDRRPTVCRKFEPGSYACDAARKEILGISDR